MKWVQTLHYQIKLKQKLVLKENQIWSKKLFIDLCFFFFDSIWFIKSYFFFILFCFYLVLSFFYFFIYFLYFLLYIHIHFLLYIHIYSLFSLFFSHIFLFLLFCLCLMFLSYSFLFLFFLIILYFLFYSFLFDSAGHHRRHYQWWNSTYQKEISNTTWYKIISKFYIDWEQWFSDLLKDTDAILNHNVLLV